MKLTVQCKVVFEKWYLKEKRVSCYKDSGYHPDNKLEWFYRQHESMKYGVYVDFFDSVGIVLLINTESKDCWWVTVLGEDVMSPYFKIGECIESETRPKARASAIEKANEIYNNQ